MVGGCVFDMDVPYSFRMHACVVWNIKIMKFDPTKLVEVINLLKNKNDIVVQETSLA